MRRRGAGRGGGGEFARPDAYAHLGEVSARGGRAMPSSTGPNRPVVATVRIRVPSRKERRRLSLLREARVQRGPGARIGGTPRPRRTSRRSSEGACHAGPRRCDGGRCRRAGVRNGVRPDRAVAPRRRIEPGCGAHRSVRRNVPVPADAFRRPRRRFLPKLERYAHFHSVIELQRPRGLLRRRRRRRRRRVLVRPD